MEQGASLPLAAWENFYVIVGSSAGALTGLQFVVMTLISEAQSAASMREIRAFGTPTVVHFCAALLISAIMSAPWAALSNVALCIAACGAAGVAYALSIIWHARKTTYYIPDAEDWVWYVVLPLVAYAALLTAAILFWSRPTSSLFVIAATTLLFMFIGIHNAWDTVTYIALRRQQTSKQAENKRPELDFDSHHEE
jgi:hypothetical protein